MSPLLVSPMDEDLLSEAHGLAGDILVGAAPVERSRLINELKAVDPTPLHFTS